MTILFERACVPVQQNRVFDERLDALNCKTGAIRVRFDAETDFAVNELFDPALMLYDQHYDNSVPSQRFRDYYDTIIDHLGAHLGDGGLVVDVGCGKGTFLQRWQSRVPKLRAVGIDPSYEGPSQIGEVRFIAEYFDPALLRERPKLVLCRHTLEHIPAPEQFLKGVLRDLPAGVPVFCEVPDLGWIVDNAAWWDFCYEHVNYFTRRSFQHCLQVANVGNARTSQAFGGQYLWAEGTTGSELVALEPTSGITGFPASQWTPPVDRSPVIWGMATKGVMLALTFADAPRCVDNNTAKQGKFAPLSGALIESPQKLEPGRPYLIVVMNPNYVAEIAEQCTQLGLDVVLVDATGHPL